MIPVASRRKPINLAWLFAQDHFGGGTGGDQRMESADRAACDGDEAEWENLSGEHWARAIDEARERWHEDVRTHKEDSGGQGEDRSRFDEGA